MKRKHLIFTAAAVAVVIIGIIIFKSIHSPEKEKPGSKTVTATRDTIVQKVTESGKVEPVTSVNVKSELAGEVIRLYVEEGNRVKAGQKLILIQPQPDEAQRVAQTKASIKSRMLDLEDAERNLRRKKALYEKGFIAKQEVEDAQKRYENSKIQLQLARRELWTLLGSEETVNIENLDLNGVDNITLKSSLDGMVTSVNVEEGEIITSGTHALGGGGTAIMTVANLDEMVVKASVNEVDVGKLEVGQDVRIGFDAIRGKIYKGKVKRISPSGKEEENIVAYPIEVEIINPDKKIRPGMTADLDIITARAENVICLPIEAVMEKNGNTMVLKRKNGNSEPQPITTGVEGDVKVEVKSGIQEGDTVMIPHQMGGFESGRRRGPPGR